MWRKSVVIVMGLIGLLAVLWWQLFTLTARPISYAELLQHYHYVPAQNSEWTWQATGPHQFSFSFISHDGERVNGRAELPTRIAARYPVLLGVSAMGNSAERWWAAEIKGRPTVTQVHRLRAMAVDAGYAVVVIDARYHGERKRADRTLDAIMDDLHWWGDKTDYENMVRGTVLDLRQTLDHLSRHRFLDTNRLKVVGYSMGAQIGLLLAGVDARVNDVVAIVPPFIDDKTAVVAPKNVAHQFEHKRLLLLSANQDEYATRAQNDWLFAQFRSAAKRHLQYDAGHVLPADYVNDVKAELLL